MLFVKTDPAGIDVPIKLLQSELFDRLKAAWGFQDADYDSYGRVYRNPVGQGYIPEAYVSNGQYREVLLDDTKTILSFFGIGERTLEKGTQSETPVHFILFINLDKITGLTQRADEEVRLEVKKFFKEKPFGFRLNETITGLSGVFSEYVLGKKTVNETARIGSRGLKEADMHPFHAFRFNMNCRYYVEQNIV